MHILHLTPYYAPAYSFGGVVRAVEGMSRSLTQLGHRISVLTTDALSLSERVTSPSPDQQHGITIYRQPNLLPILRHVNLSTPSGMHNLAERLLPTVDVLHVHEFRTLENVILVPLAAKRGIPIVLSPHGTLAYHTGRTTLKTLWDRWLSPSIARHIQHIIGLTAHEIAEAHQVWTQVLRLPPPRFSQIPNGIDLAEFRAMPDPQPFRERYGLGTAHIILFLGRLHPRKGAHLLLSAFQLADLPHTKLVIAGPDEGLAEQLRAQAKGDDRVVFTGYLDATTRLEALAVADVFVLPAMGEGLSIAALEALAAGLPVILSPECYLPEVERVGAGWIVPPEPPALSEALRRMFQADTPRHAMAEAARHLVETRFTWDIVATQLEATYAMG